MGVGLFAIQFAHQHGAQVITTTSTSNATFVRSLGADVVIDYTQTHVEEEVHQVDLVLDTVGGEGTVSTLITLKPGGALLTIAGQPDERQAQALGGRTAFFRAHMGDTAQLLTTISRRIDEGRLRMYQDNRSSSKERSAKTLRCCLRRCLLQRGIELVQVSIR